MKKAEKCDHGLYLGIDKLQFTRSGSMSDVQSSFMDAKFFGLFSKLRGAALKRLARFGNHDLGEAEDLAAQAFLRLQSSFDWARIKGLDTEMQIKIVTTYLFKCLSSAIGDRFKGSVESDQLEDERIQFLVDSKTVQDWRLETQLPGLSDINECPNPKLVAVKAAFRAATREDQEIIRLRFWSELTYQQIEDYIGIKKSTAKGRYERALRRFGENLSDRLGIAVQPKIREGRKS